MATTQAPSDAPPLDLSRDLEALSTAVAVASWGPTTVVRIDEAGDPLGALRSLDSRIARGDQLWIHISGHGNRVPDDNRDEADGWDEGLLLADGSVVRDDALAPVIELLRRRLGPEGHLAITLDLCHSGGLLRGLASSARGSGPALSGSDTLGQEWLSAGAEVAALTILAASRPDELAEEHPDGGGRFSRALAHALARTPPEATWASLFGRIQAELALAAPGQHPVLLGAAQRPIGVGSAATGGLPVDGVVAGSPPLLRVAGGRLLGFDERDRFSLRLPEGEACPATVHAVTDSQVLLAAGCAAASEQLAGARVVVERDGAASSLLQVDLPSALAARLLPVLAAEGWEVGPSALRLAVVEDALVLQSPTGTLARAAADGAWAESPVAVELRRRRRAAELSAVELHGAGALTLRLRRADPETCAPGPVLQPGADGLLMLPPGVGLTVEVQHAAPSARALQLVHFDEDNRATALVDAHEAPVLSPGESWVSPRCWQTVPPWGTERLKLIATREAVALAPWLSGMPLRGDWTQDGSTTTLTYTVTGATAWAEATP